MTEYDLTNETVAAIEREREKQLKSEEDRVRFEQALLQVRALASLHRAEPSAIDWEEKLQTPAPFGAGEFGPHTKEVMQRQSGRRSLAERIFPSKARKAAEERERELAEAAGRDQEIMMQWFAMRDLARDVLAGKPEAWNYVIGDAGALDFWEAYGKAEAKTDTERTVTVSAAVCMREVLPSERLKVTEEGTIAAEKRTDVEFFALEKTFVASAVLRTARNIFAALPAVRVIVHVSDVREGEEVPILSVRVPAAQIERVNFEKIDPVFMLGLLEGRIDFDPGKGFVEITKIGDLPKIRL